MFIAKTGIPWIAVTGLITLASYLLIPEDAPSIWPYLIVITIPLAILTGFIVYFFRDPDRTPDQPYKPGASILSPADGSLCAFEEENGNLALYIEMHVTNVHVTRAHFAGTVKKVTRASGPHYSIYFLKKRVGADSIAIKKNARVIIELEDEQGKSFVYNLVCGKLARRARPYVKAGDKVAAGQRIGVIAFGSLVKATLPGTQYRMITKLGENVFGGKTVLCEKL